MTIKFHTCLILMKDIEHVVKDATNMWKNIDHLQKPNENPIQINDDDDDDSDKDEDNEEENTPCVTIDAKDYQDFMKDDEEEKEDDAKEEARKEEEEESDLVRIVVKVIASLPQSPVKTTT